MLDEITQATILRNTALLPIVLIRSKQIYLVRAIEEGLSGDKRYLRSLLMMVGNEIVTSNYSDSKLLLAEIKLFEKGNKQNKYTSVEKFDNDINLKLKLSTGHIYISKAEAQTIMDIYADSKSGVRTERLLDFEVHFRLEQLITMLGEYGFLNKRKK
jgi:hypothetical protein